jgi:acetyltransferase-like isoleucine patch superfamily enzyme
MEMVRAIRAIIEAMSLLRASLQAARRLRLGLHRNLELGANCTLGGGVLVETGGGHVVIGPDCTVSTGAVFAAYGGRIELARLVFVGPHAVIYGHGNVTIGEGSLLSMHCRILSSNHTLAPFGTPIRSQPDIPLPTRIGRDVWLGAGVTVLGGVTIGDGCVVGAGAVVTKDLPAGAIAYGVPASIRGSRDGAPAVAGPS